MPFKSHWHALTKASTIIKPVLNHLNNLGFTTIFVPSLSFTDVIDHKRIRFNSQHLPKDKISNFPIFAWSRSPVVVSPEMTNMRRILVTASKDLKTGTPYPLNYAAGTFTLNWMVMFNDITDYEEFEVVYTAERLFSNFREYIIVIPALYGFAKLPESERTLYVGAEWEMFSNTDTSKLNDYVQFSLTGTAQITFPVLTITDIELPLVQELELNFFSDLDFNNRRESYVYTKNYDEDLNPTGMEIKQTYKEERIIYKEGDD